MDRKDILDLLERKSALYVLMEVKEHPGASKSEVTNREPLNVRTKFVRIEELVAAGLITENRDPRKHATVKLYLSPEGQEIADAVERIINSAKSLPEMRSEQEE
ncbi:MAG: hypothetical protein IKP04_05535 [Candidatus Methanomethylophilaceae archaeon]|nr:hypothetical protein [Candidatus Methanomethylophilaceae archaeon]